MTTDDAIRRTMALRLLQRELRGQPLDQDDEPGEAHRGRPIDRFRGLQLLGLGDEYT